MTLTMKTAKTFALRIALPVAAILFLMLWVGGAFRRGTIQGGSHPVPEESAEGLTTVTVSSQTLPTVSEITGTVRAEQLATVTSRVVASILDVRVAAGRKVASGQTLVVLDDRDLRRRVEQAQEAVHAAEATVAQAQSDYKRDKPLFEQKVIPAHEFDRTETNLKTAEANLRRLQQALEEAGVGLSYAVIRSPFAGVIVDKLANVGDLATPGKPLFSVYEEGRLWLEAGVPEEMLQRIHLGDTLSMRIDARGQGLQGRVVEIVPSSDPATRTVTVRVHLNDTRDVVPGMFGRLLVPAAEERVLTVPASAVIRAGQLTLADVVKGGRVQRRSVQLGNAVGDQFEVYSGLDAGEVVVVRGARAAARE